MFPVEPMTAAGGPCEKEDWSLSWLHWQQTWRLACPVCLSGERERTGKQSPLEPKPSCWKPPKRIEQDKVMGFTAVGKSQKKSKDQKWEKSGLTNPDLAGIAESWWIISSIQTRLFHRLLIPFSSVEVTETCKVRIWKRAKEALESAKTCS